MLAISFFAAIFSSLLWLIYSLAYINDNTTGIKFNSLGIVDISIYTALVVLPILALWIIFGHINQYLNLRNTNRNLHHLFKQMKKNQDYTDLIARIMLESEQQIKDGFILNRIDILISDMNELIAEMISRAALASHEQIESLWGKIRNGGKWAMGKVIIEISQSQPNFQMRIYEKSQRDIVLAGTVLEFCSRYQNILALLEKHDKERVFLTVVETGVFGKVYSIIAPIADEIRRHRDVRSMRAKEELNDFKAPEDVSARQEARPATYQPQREEKPNPLIAGISKLGSILRKEKPISRNETVAARERDSFSMALERSFGNHDEPELTASTEPQFEIAKPIVTEDNLSYLTAKIDEPHFSEQELKISLNEEHIQAPEIIFGGRNEPMMQDERAEIIIGKPEESNIPPLIISEEPKTQMRAEPEPEPAPITSTQKTLNSLKKEWEDMRKVSKDDEAIEKESPKVATEDYTYPFGGWTDESNYNK